MLNKFKITLNLLLVALMLVPYFGAYADAPVSLSRFGFVEAECEGALYDAGEMSDGMVFVCAEGHSSGYLDKEGKKQLDFMYSYAGSFVDGLAPAGVQYGKKGYIDKSGKFAIEPVFDSASEFSCGLALVTKGDKTGFIDKTGKFVDIIDSDKYTPVTSFNSGVCWVENDEGMRAVINTEGKFVTGFDFVWSSQWSEGVCWASKNMDDDFNHISMGLIDKTGDFIIEPGKYTDAQVFCEGLCWVKKTDESRIYLIDIHGNEIKSISDGLMPSSFSGGICVNLGGDVLSVMNTEGVVIYSSIRYFPVHYGGFSEGKMLVRGQQDGKYYIMSDLDWTPSENSDESISGYGYEEIEAKDNSFEIALKINSPYALVNGQRTMIDENDERICAFIQNGRTLLPMRFIAETLPDYSVTWDYLASGALVQSDYISLLLAPNNDSVQVVRYMPEMCVYENHTQRLDQPPINLYDRLFLPVRALCEMLGVNVFYDERGLVVVSNARSELTYSEAGYILEQL